MSNSNKFEKHTLRKHIKPLIDIDEDEDDRRRDSSGRKRVDVIQCLLESSSSDDNETEHTTKQNSNEIVWLTFAEICHIRTVLAQTSDSNRTLNKDTQQSRIFQNERCFRCQKPMNFLFLPLSLYSNDTSICCVCQEKVCKNCSMTNFLSPSLKHCFPVRTKTILNSSSTPVEYPINPMHESIPNSKTICFACSQIFDRYRKPSRYSIKPSVNERSLSFMSFNLPFSIPHYRQDSNAFFSTNHNKVDEATDHRTPMVTRF